MLVILVAGAACARREKACKSGAERKSKKERLRMSPSVLMMWTKILLAGQVRTLEKRRKTAAVQDASATSYASFARRALGQTAGLTLRGAFGRLSHALMRRTEWCGVAKTISRTLTSSIENTLPRPKP